MTAEFEKEFGMLEPGTEITVHTSSSWHKGTFLGWDSTAHTIRLAQRTNGWKDYGFTECTTIRVEFIAGWTRPIKPTEHALVLELTRKERT